MIVNKANFLDYLGHEEQNLLTSLLKYRSEFDLFYDLDQIYQNPLQRLEVSNNKKIVPQLYLFVHFHLYFSISCFLRTHLSECLSSIRKAIDATLSAYKIILEPETAGKYRARDKTFQFIKTHVKSKIKEDSSKYPLAHQLIEIHDACSQFGSHADISSFFHRLEDKKISGTKKGHIIIRYFQFAKQDEECHFYFISTLQAFYLMFKIFKLFFDVNLKIIDPKWELVIETLGPELERLRKKYFSQIKS